MQNITIYTTPTCGFCHKLKEWMNFHQISYKEKNVKENYHYRKELLDFGVKGVPLTVIKTEDGPFHISGFNPEKLKQHFHIN
ncbi:hypothetical protein AAV35_004445 [Salimicrobium jeotgali]|uniref:Glutaredoxin n=1 Tax=Salimicrobium jeotgali TaxID=1230341 RepID=K2GLI5_9BACI|nr:glutaredoxin family protein [Salimicrobium jeotgali]AKG04106.1 hypothetical protein AAV35_004445 [Salimicrobium jeotgali]EKE31234.1 glutaredoxin [Salimicrobium jeotgali]MBM7697203.1 glutaredoxin [Salimicrobium jeotgali]